jgi:hypothetical protein
MTIQFRVDMATAGALHDVNHPYRVGRHGRAEIGAQP